MNLVERYNNMLDNMVNNSMTNNLRNNIIHELVSIFDNDGIFHMEQKINIIFNNFDIKNWNFDTPNNDFRDYESIDSCLQDLVLIIDEKNEIYFTGYDNIEVYSADNKYISGNYNILNL